MGLCLIYNIALIFSFEVIYPETLEINNMIAEIISLKEETNYYFKYEIKVCNYNLKYSKGTKLILYTKNNKLFPGDIIKLNGEFEKGEKAYNYKQFNYRNYLKQLKIYGILHEKNISKIDNNKDIYYFFGRIRNFLIERISFNYDEETYGFMQSILIGDANNLQNDIKEYFKYASISHILAISGMHISIIIAFLEYVIKIFIQNKKVRNLLLIIFLIFFYIITGMSISCFRAIIMVSVNLVGFNFRRKTNFISSLIFSLIIIIFTNVYNVFNVGLWLSFMGVFGIYVFSNALMKIITHFYKKDKKILKVVVPYVSTQILILPIIIFSFNVFSCFSFMSNILVVFLIDKILILGYISIILNSKSLANINSFFVSIIFKVSKLASIGKVYLKTPNIIFLIIYYLILFNTYIFSKKYKFKFWKNLLNNKTRIAYKIIFFSILIIFVFNHLNLNTKFNLYFVDIGQGDCTVIKTPHGKNIIIDGGESNNIILPYLLDRGINKIDYLIVSHFDNDHVQGLFSIMQNISVKKAIIGRQFEMSENYKTFLDIAKNNKIEILVAEAGYSINIEKNLSIDVLWPSSQNIINENILNNNSLVFKLIFNKFSILFTGDIEEVAEKCLVENYGEKLDSTIIKVAHHGSKTSSTKDFLKNVNPKIAMIGVGRKNKFGHPSNITIENLENINCNIYRTDEMGEITIEIKKEKIRIKTHFKIKNNI